MSIKMNKRDAIVREAQMKTETNLQIAGRIAIETVTRYLPDESPDVGRGRRCLEFLESQIEAALNAERDRAFDKGYVCAVANVMNLHGAETIAREVLNANRPKDRSIIDKVDRDALKPIFDHEKAVAAIRGSKD